MKKSIFAVALLLSLQSFASGSLSCQIVESAERSAFLDSVQSDIREGIASGQYTESLLEQVSQINAIFIGLNKELCLSDEFSKSEKEGLKGAAQADIKEILESEKVAKSDADFLETIAGLFSRAIHRL
jgi:hypothetical protein